MKSSLIGAFGLALTASVAQAGGIERSPQSAMILYETGNLLQFSLAYIEPELTGENVSPPFPPQTLGTLTDSFVLPTFELKFDLSDRLALAFRYERPFGADVTYEDGNVPFGGTVAQAHTQSLTALMRYRFNDNFSVFGGLRMQQAGGNIDLRGAAYGPLSGYSVDLDDAVGHGYVLGVAYEIPDIALRVALTYNSAISHDMKSHETGPLIDPDGPGPLPPLPLLDGVSTTEVKTPESWNLEFQTGIAPDTLLFGSVLYVKHTQFRVDAERFVAVAQEGLIDLEDSTTYTLGVGRRFNDRVSGAVSVIYEAPGDKLLSPLSPTIGFTQLRLSGSYAVNDKVTLSGGLGHIWLGDGQPQTGNTARADFTDNTAWALGLQLSYRF
ncbi:OmpP1/FadL family transporter [Salipiger abyssi]|uniref:OmpP1/FadL family transporter n=1 Tax=Salipiger abyssi TaxID=1250539 RepID=UPI001A8E9D34|nr:outer membrane protein transport protein [Salipiger abyssi]MBN9886513.1 outer membrane protein transport protein [Salipiger abyssi]